MQVSLEWFWWNMCLLERTDGMDHEWSEARLLFIAELKRIDAEAGVKYFPRPSF